MKVKTKVKGGPRDCGGGGITQLPPGVNIPQSDSNRRTSVLDHDHGGEDQVRAGHGCGDGI